MLVLVFVIGNELPTAYGQPTPQLTEANPVKTEPAKFISKEIFKESELSAVMVHPVFDDSTTNIAFYIKCPTVACPDNGTVDSPVYLFSAENLGQEMKPFSAYWAPPALTDYIAIEYKNDKQQFTCSDLTFAACQADPHFVTRFDFSLVDESITITPALLAEKNPENEGIVASTPDAAGASTASEALKTLSINLSAASITSDLEDGTIVTAILDGTSTVPVVATTSDGKEGTSFGDFLLDIVESVIDIFTPSEPELPATTTATSTEEVESEPELPVELETNSTEPESELEPALTTGETINETTTTEF